MRKKGTKNKKYSPEFKISVILDMRNNHLSYSETVRKYWGTQTKAETSDYRFTLRKWERVYLEEGEISLYNDGRVKQIRVYSKDHTSLVDIEYSIHQGNKKLHAHDYIAGERQQARDLYDKELKKYSRFFGGKK